MSVSPALLNFTVIANLALESRPATFKTKAPTKSEDIQEHSIFLKPKEEVKRTISRGK